MVADVSLALFQRLAHILKVHSLLYKLSSDLESVCALYNNIIVIACTSTHPLLPPKVSIALFSIYKFRTISTVIINHTFASTVRM